MQEVPPNTTLFLCAAWRRLGTRNEIPPFAAGGSSVVSGPCFLFAPAQRQVSELPPYLERLNQCRVHVRFQKATEKDPRHRPTEIASCLHNYLRSYLLVRLIDGRTERYWAKFTSK